MTKQARIEEPAEDRRRIREELEKRDFSDVPTAKLLQRDLEYLARLIDQRREEVRFFRS
ncbi:MAG: hypothetical protein ACXV2F_03610 [Halobacteriota archaeon]